MPYARYARLPCSVLMLTGAVALLSLAGPAAAQHVSREQDIIDLRLGQKVLVDDGSCPNGQIKEVMGATLTEAGVTRTVKCVARLQRR
ncbi:DUF6719 family protein [Rhodopseudomonas pseudopalustris]|uniref:Uncharacterized protein n=2 Tax=Rhodopseudomonas TaxID=1073 RepID=Q135S3_RHOPS|nr:DUF6719 family protein [Rhodopseudomonas pseudopalustris]ABE40166.1 conserved hypothetical protein [Rhodopseudomonas palustris BisB5]MBB1090853.1 hypothetical protein [Rhodopseudomonas palustris]SEP27813.1 hypothetical protein SAMN05444123_112153 [Rhodopseudomonas pseudopalustris]